MKNYRLFKVLFYWSNSNHSKIYQNIVICSLYNLNIIFFRESKGWDIWSRFCVSGDMLVIECLQQERFVIRKFAYFKPIWCTYLKYTHFTYWSLKLKRNVCITCRAISLTSKPETNLANPRLLIFFYFFFCWYIPLRVVCLLNNSKNSRNFFYLKWIHVFFCSLLVIMNFSHHIKKGFFNLHTCH